jgi:hypothetical protein
MRLLHSQCSTSLLLVSVVWLCFTGLPSRAANEQSAIDPEQIDLAKILAGGKVVFVSSGQRSSAFRAIDDDRRTVFEFSSSDPRPTIVVKLNEKKPIHRVSLVLGSESEKIDVYLLNELPEEPSALDKTKPIASIVDLAVARETVVDFAPQTAQYVALRWTWSKKHLRSAAIAEMGVFSDSAPDAAVAATLTAADPPPTDPVPGPPLIVSVSP